MPLLPIAAQSRPLRKCLGEDGRHPNPAMMATRTSVAVAAASVQSVPARRPTMGAGTTLARPSGHQECSA